MGPPVGGPAESGERVLQDALADAKATYGERLVSAYRLGSLAHGGFSPDVSDVDLALVLDRIEPRDAERIGALQARVAERLDTPLARRISVFWSSWEALRGAVDVGSGASPGGGRFPLVDRLDLARDGRLVHGIDRRAEVPWPGADALVLEGAQFIVARLADPARDALLTDPVALLAAGVREASKAVLFPVRFIATAETGDVLANPQAAAHVIATRTGAVADLTAAALRWRAAGLGDPAVDAALLTAGLPALHAELASVYGPRLEALGRPELADVIRAWASRIGGTRSCWADGVPVE